MLFSHIIYSGNIAPSLYSSQFFLISPSIWIHLPLSLIKNKNWLLCYDNKIKQKLIHQNRTKQMEGKGHEKRHKEQIQTQGVTQSHTQEYHKNTKLEAMIYIQNTSRIKKKEYISITYHRNNKREFKRKKESLDITFETRYLQRYLQFVFCWPAIAYPSE